MSTGSANVAIVCTEKPEENKWDPILPKDVPEALKHPEIMGQLVDGHMVQIPGDSRFFRGIVLQRNRFVLPASAARN